MTTVFEVGGDSMAPTLVRGSRVLVAPLVREVRAGDVVLLRSSDTPVLHRVVITFREGGVLWLLHRGDSGGRPAAAPAAAVAGRAVGILGAGLDGVPSPEELSPRELWAFRRAQWLARGYVWARRAARAVGWRTSHGGPAYNEPTLAEEGSRTDCLSPAGEPESRREGPALERGGVGLRIAPGLAWRLVDGEAAVVDLSRGRAVGLNRTASLVWSLLADHDEAAIVEAIAERFQIDAATARADVRRLLATLHARGLVVEA